MSGAKKNRLQTSNRWKNCQFIVIRWMFYTFDLSIINCHSCSANMIILRIGEFHVSSNHLMLSIALVQCMFFTPTFALILNHTVYSVISSNTFVCRQWRIESNRIEMLFFFHLTAPAHSILLQIMFMFSFICRRYKRNCACIPKLNLHSPHTSTQARCTYDLTHIHMCATDLVHAVPRHCRLSIPNKLISVHLSFLQFYLQLANRTINWFLIKLMSIINYSFDILWTEIVCAVIIKCETWYLQECVHFRIQRKGEKYMIEWYSSNCQFWTDLNVSEWRVA